MKALVFIASLLAPFFSYAADTKQVLEQSAHAARTINFATVAEIVIAVAIVLVFTTIYFIARKRA